jgi:MoaE-MoaD fusion protein
MSSVVEVAAYDSRPEMLRVLLLGPLRLALQAEFCYVAFPLDGSQEVFWHSLSEQFPDLESRRRSIRLVRNNQFLLPEEKLKPGDEIALIPPVSGGSS